MYTRFNISWRICQKLGKFCIVALWWIIIVLKTGPELMAVGELFSSKQSEDPEAENRKPTLLMVKVETYF